MKKTNQELVGGITLKNKRPVFRNCRELLQIKANDPTGK
jgi:hypothetical protein